MANKKTQEVNLKWSRRPYKGFGPAWWATAPDGSRYELWRSQRLDSGKWDVHWLEFPQGDRLAYSIAARNTADSAKEAATIHANRYRIKEQHAD